MIDFVVFIGSQFFNLLMYLDDLKIIGSLSILRVIIILLLFIIGFKFISGGEKR